jgi:hypothetical protein
VLSKSIGDRWRSANRRRDARTVRIHPEVGQVPAPAKHRAPARGAGAALKMIEAEAPVAPFPVPAGFVAHERTARWLADQLDRLERGAADDEAEANHLLGRAAWARGIAAQMREMRIAAESAPTAQPDGPQVPLDDDAPALAGDLCFGCGRSRDTLPCYSALEGRDVPLCPRCHPSADEIDDTGADGEEPERVEPTTAHAGSCCCAHCESEASKDHARAHAEDLPEGVAGEPAPVSGPAAVPQLQQRRDTETIRLPWGKPRVLDDTLIDLYALDGVEL